MSTLLPTQDLYQEAVDRRSREVQAWARERTPRGRAHDAAARTRAGTPRTLVPAPLRRSARAIEATLMQLVGARHPKRAERTHH